MKTVIDDYFYDADKDRQLEVRQGYALSDIIKLMKDMLNNKTLVHNSPVLRWSLLNFAIKVGTSGDLMATKLKDSEKIDPVVALLIALETAIRKGFKR